MKRQLNKENVKLFQLDSRISKLGGPYNDLGILPVDDPLKRHARDGKKGISTAPNIFMRCLVSMKTVHSITGSRRIYNKVSKMETELTLKYNG